MSLHSLTFVKGFLPIAVSHSDVATMWHSEAAAKESESVNGLMECFVVTNDNTNGHWNASSVG